MKDAVMLDEIKTKSECVYGGKSIEKKIKIWEQVIECSKKVAYGSSVINIKKGKEGILQLSLIVELNYLGYKIRKECPFSPRYMDSKGEINEVGDRTYLSPDISIVDPTNFIIECKHGLCPEAMYQLKVYLQHKEDVNAGCTIEWNIEKDETISIYSTLLIKGKDNDGKEKFICIKKKELLEINRKDDIIEMEI